MLIENSRSSIVEEEIMNPNLDDRRDGCMSELGDL